MANSKHIAGLLGPALMAISITESMNLDIFANTSAHLVYLNGTLLFVAGLSIIRVHNCWMVSWPILVTVIGWFALLAGLVRMIDPVSAQQAGQHTTAVLALTFVLLVIGILLTFKAYGREEQPAGN